MTEHIHGTIKQGETIIFADLGLTLIGRNVAGGIGTKGGSFHVPDAAILTSAPVISCTYRMADGRK